jgi:hypothetical protein
MASENDTSSPMSTPEGSTNPGEPDFLDLEADLDALYRAERRQIAVAAALRLLGPALLVAVLLSIGVYAYVVVANLRAKTRAHFEKDPVKAMESLLRAAGEDVDTSKLYLKDLDVEE